MRSKHLATRPSSVKSAVRNQPVREAAGQWYLENLETRRLLSFSAEAGYGALPMSFEPNVGQTDAKVDFLSRGNGYALFLTDSEAVMTLASSPDEAAVVRMQLVGANAAPQVEASQKLAGRTNYLLGNDPAQWHTDISNYGRVEYNDVYAGIDLSYLGNQQELQYDFVVAAGADPSAIKLNFAGVSGLSITAAGELVLATSAGELKHQTPFIYQEIDGQRRQVSGGFVIDEQNQVGFTVGAYDTSKPLVIDPTLVYSTFLGGSQRDEANAIAVDANGRAYVTGFTFSGNFPETTSLGIGGQREVFVTQVNAAGNGLVYSTVIGGQSDDEGRGIAVDAAGNAYVTGYTESDNFPLASPFDITRQSSREAFILKLNAAGNALVYSTFLGGDKPDEGTGIAVDLSGSAYVTGFTESAANVATTGDTTHNGGIDGFVTKLNPSGTARLYSTYIGGGGTDQGRGIAVDTGGHAHVAGRTTSGSSFSAVVLGAGGSDDAFVTKVNPLGTGLIYSTRIGGSDVDEANSIALDSLGHAYVAGTTKSGSGLPGGLIGPGGAFDAFVTKMSLAGSAAVYSTRIGGGGDDFGQAVSVDLAGSAHITGYSASSGFPSTDPLPAPHNGSTHKGNRDVVVAKLNSVGTGLLFSSYIGSNGAEEGRGIVVDAAGAVYVTGYTDSSGFPTANAADTTYNGNIDAFVLKLNGLQVGNQKPTASPQAVSTNEDTDVTITLTGDDGDPTFNQTLTFRIASLPTNGQLYQTSDGVTRGAAINTAGVVVTDAQHRVIFAPDANENGTPYATFQFTVTDNGTPNLTSDPASVTVSVAAVNDAPVVAANVPSVTLDEGQTATNSGTFGDLDGDTVTLNASAGTVTNNANGTWSWSLVTTDGPLSQTITITADDGNGGSASTTFSLTVDNVAPTAGLGNAGNVIYGGGIDASFSNVFDPSSADTAAGFRYAYALGSPASLGAATYANSGTDASVSFAGLDAGDYTIYARVIDKDGGYSQYSTNVTVDPRALTVAASGINKVYDGTTVATVNLSDSRLVGDSLAVSYSSASFNNKQVGTGKPVGVSGISVTGADAGNYTFNTTATTSADITPLALTGSITAGNKVYDGTTSATVTGRSLATIIAGDDVSYVGGIANFADASAGIGKTVAATGLSLAGADAGNYTVNTTATTTADIDKANAIIVVNGYGGVYDGAAHGATGSASGVLGEDLSGLLNLGASFTNVPGGTANWSFAGNTNYNIASGTAAIVISKASASITVTPYTVTYDGDPHTSAGTATGVLGEDLAGLLDLSLTTHTNAGTYNDGWSFAGSTNYNATSGNVTNTINKADAVISVSGYTGVYDGNAHGATGSAAGVKGESLSGLDLGANFTNVPGGTAHWTFTDVTGNYNDAAGTAAIVISKANASITVTPYSVTYNGLAHTATGSAIGVKGETLVGLDLSATIHTNAGTYLDGWTFNDVTGNYHNAGSNVTDVIAKANATIVVNGYTGVYDANAHGATGTANGVLNEDLGSLLDLGASFTDVPGGTANWSFAGDNNYNADSGTAAIVITKATASITVNGYSGVYDGNAHGATGSASGVGGADLSGQLNLGASFTDVPGGTANWTFSGGTNYFDASGTAAIVISKANATISVNGYTGVYDAQAHGATGIATGVKGEDLTSLLTLGATFTNVPGGVANWAFAGNGNYNLDSGSVNIVITKADANVTVTPYTVTYDGNSHTAAGSATGVGGVNLAGLDLSGTTHTNAGTYIDGWTFTDVTGNYNDAAGTLTNTIVKANAVVSVNGYSGVYDGNAHGASGIATGVNGEDLAGLSLGASFTNVPGGTANWTFTDVTGNYNDASGSVQIEITKANADINVAGYTVTYDAVAHTATGSATGVGGVSLAGLNLAGTTHTDAGTYTDGWTFTDVTGNYHDASGTVTDTIDKASLTVTVDPSTRVVGQPNPAFTVSYDGFVGSEGSSVLGGALAFTTTAAFDSGPGTYAVSASGLDSNNYTIAFVPGAMTVTAVSVQDDDCGPGQMLVVGGTNGNDQIHVTPTSDGYIVVTLNGAEAGRFLSGDIDRIVAYGLGGDDWIQIAGTITQKAWIYGDDGNDYLNLGAGGGIAFGGNGNDELLGGGGRDILVGGNGGDRMIGNSGDDIMISGYTDYDNRFTFANHADAWCSIWHRWNSSNGFTTRIDTIQNTGAAYFLTDATVQDDGAGDQIDMLNGSAGEDWYVYKYGQDKVTGMSKTESAEDMTVA